MGTVKCGYGATRLFENVGKYYYSFPITNGLIISELQRQRGGVGTDDLVYPGFVAGAFTMSTNTLGRLLDGPHLKYVAGYMYGSA